MTQPADNHVSHLAFLTPTENGNEYRPLCERFGLAVTPGGWGLALLTTPTGERHTLFTSNVDYLRLVQAGVAAGAITDDAPEPLRLDVFEYRRAGWPNDWKGSAR